MAVKYAPDEAGPIVGGISILVIVLVILSALAKPLGKKVPPLPPAGLAITSHFDEAWQVLHHIRATQNPLAVKSGLFAHLIGRMRDYVYRRGEIARIFGTVTLRDIGWPARCLIFVIYCGGIYFTVFFGGQFDLPIGGNVVVPRVFIYVLVGLWMFVSGLLFSGLFSAWSPQVITAFFWPLRRAAHLVRSIAILPNEIGTYIARNRSWSLLQTMVLGLDGYRFEFPPVEMVPRHIGSDAFQLEMLPETAERRALARRADWLGKDLGNAAETFSKLTVTASDMTALLEAIEKDQELVHGAYYTDDVCIDRIADWIVGIEFRQNPSHTKR